jgi:anti-sigma factor RsiW
MKCEEMLAALGDYVDGELDADFCAAFEQHMAGCDPCVIVIDNLRNTIRAYSAGDPYEMPAEFHDRLCGLLKQAWRRKFPGAS